MVVAFGLLAGAFLKPHGVAGGPCGGLCVTVPPPLPAQFTMASLQAPASRRDPMVCLKSLLLAFDVIARPLRESSCELVVLRAPKLAPDAARLGRLQAHGLVIWGLKMFTVGRMLSLGMACGIPRCGTPK